MPDSPPTRRHFLQHASITGAGLLLPTLAAPQKSPSPEQPKDAEGISPAEDLMREHGVLNRILLIYDDHLRMLNARQPFDGSVLVNAADIIRHFVEDYHEKLEEDFLFPRFRKAGKLVTLVDTLLTQHKAGRHLTAQIRELAALPTLKYVSDADKLADALRAFLHMYRPHEAREDTVLFPAFRSIVSRARVRRPRRRLRKEGRRTLRRRRLLQSSRPGSRTGEKARHLRSSPVHTKMNPGPSSKTCRADTPVRCL